MAISYIPVTNTLDFQVSYNPGGAFPLDARSIFGSYESAAAAAASAEAAGSSNTRYYFGQEITVLENDVVSHYSIQVDGTLKPIGKEFVGDNKTVVVDGTEIGLKAFGVGYYKYYDADNILAESADYVFPGTMPAGIEGAFVKVSETWYKYTTDAWAVADVEPHVEPYYIYTEGWKSGLEPKVALADGGGYELAWYEPSKITVEGVSSIVSSLQTNVETLETTVADNKTASDNALAQEVERATTAEEALAARVGTNEGAIATLNGDAETEGSVKNQIAAAVAAIMENPDDTMNSIQELVDWINAHATDALELSNNVSANSAAISELEGLVGTLPEGITATDVVGYVQEAIAAEKTRAEGVEAALESRLASVEGSTTKLGTAAEKNVEFFATAEQGAKADTAVQEVTSGSNGHILVDGTDVTVYEAPTASASVAGDVKVDGTTITATDGTISVGSITSEKVSDLETKLAGAVTEAKTYSDETFVQKTSITVSSDVPTLANASEEKVLSEKAIIDALTWKTTM